MYIIKRGVNNNNNKNSLVPLYILIVFYCLLIRTKVQSFNIEERLSIWKTSQPGSYFGFSVAQHYENLTNKHWILVGAPLADNLQPNTSHSGALFKCPITLNHTDCVQISTDGRRDDIDYTDTDTNDDSLLPPQDDEIKNGQWLGVTVKSYRPSGQIVVCAHRYIQSSSLLYHHYGVGLCYILDNDFKVTDDLQFCKGKPMDKLHQQFGLCQSGTSLSILSDGYVVVGTPGPYTWRGTIFAKEIVGDFLDRDKTIYMGPLDDNPKPINKYSYMGMSVTGGHFFNKKHITYVSGAHRSNYTGQVFFLQRHKNNETLSIVATLSGEQLGSSYGYEILAIDIDNDGLDELLVAAPFYFNGAKGGAVYIYKNLQRKSGGNKPIGKLEGVLESRFGFAMAALGDINKDGWGDVAIGAPYEGTGAVYIYLGGKNGLNQTYSQKIVNEQVVTLGYALSGGFDVDGNGYPDLVVGAYESDRVALYQTRPIIHINITVNENELKNINATKTNSSEDVCFKFSVCFQLSPFKFNEPLRIDARLTEVTNHIHRIYPHESSQFNTTITIKSTMIEPHCDEKIACILPSNSDILSPIKFLANYTLDNNIRNSPILNKTSVHEFEAKFQKDCGGDETCHSQLVLDIKPAYLTQENGKYLLDLNKNNELILQVDVLNLGEAAYETQLFIEHRKDLSYIAIVDKNKTNNIICSPKNETLKCDIANPLTTQTQIHFKLRFEFAGSNEAEFNLTANVTTTSNNTSGNNKTIRKLTILLNKIAKLSIKGTGTNLVFYGGEIKGESAMKYLEDIGVGVNHTYQVTNDGQWRVPEFQVTILWPYQVQSRGKEGKWLLYLTNFEIDGQDNNTKHFCRIIPTDGVNPLNLTENYMGRAVRRRRRETDNDLDGRKSKTMDCLDNSAKCIQITCNIIKLATNNQATIKIMSRLWNSTLVEDYSNIDLMRIYSRAQITIPEKSGKLDPSYNSSVKVETLAYPKNIIQSGGLNIWIIIGSVIVGFLLLILLVIGLYKCGFFKRNRVKDTTLSGNLLKTNESEGLLDATKQ